MTRRRNKRGQSDFNKEDSFLSKLMYDGNTITSTELELIQYDGGQISSSKILPEHNLKDKINKHCVNWFKLKGLADATEIDRICKDFGLHGFDVKDLLSNQLTVKAVVYDDVTFVLMPIFMFDDSNAIVSSHIGFILGKHYLVSIQESSEPIFEDVKNAISDNLGLLREKNADFLLYILLNCISSSYLHIEMRLEDELYDCEDKLLDNDNSPAIMHLIRKRRIDYIRMKRSVTSMREELVNVIRNSNKLIEAENIVYFNDFDDRLRAVGSNLETSHELLNSLLDLYFSNSNTRMNEVMKRLTLVSTIFIPLTFMAGVWGMNFKFMPETEFKYGYLVAWVTFAFAAIASYYFLKKKKWF